MHVGAHGDLKAENTGMSSFKRAVNGRAEVKLLDFDLSATALALATQQWQAGEGGIVDPVPRVSGSLGRGAGEFVLSARGRRGFVGVF
jgi:hypothetical protein